MAQHDLRQDKPYRRGLILGLTMAEVMILLIFLLLMALAAALAARDSKIAILDKGGASRLVEAVRAAYPEARSSNDYFKELKRTLDMRRELEAAVKDPAQRETLLADAAVGRAVRESAKPAGADKPGYDFDQIMADAALGKSLREAGAARGLKSDEDLKRVLGDAKIGQQVRKAAMAAGSNDPEQFINSALGKSKGSKKGQWPPFFSLSEAGGYYFDSGKATLKPQFERNLRNIIIPLLQKNIEDYGVDVVEVIGHTDEVPMVGASNLDASLIGASEGQVPIGALQSTDNAGLAIARAVAVVTVLRSDPRLAGVTILPLSAAQMIVPVDHPANGTETGSDERRRRIEIRLRRSTSQAVPSAGLGMRVVEGQATKPNVSP